MGAIEKRSSFWFQFLGLKVLSDNNPNLGVSIYMTGEKAMGASTHDRGGMYVGSLARSQEQDTIFTR